MGKLICNGYKTKVQWGGSTSGQWAQQHAEKEVERQDGEEQSKKSCNFLRLQCLKEAVHSVDGSTRSKVTAQAETITKTNNNNAQNDKGRTES